MKKYHGTPVSGTRRDALLFLNSRHALVSFAKPQNLQEVLNVCDGFCLDNGAFSIWKKGGGVIDEQAYYEWVSPLTKHPAFDFFIIPDVIDGGVEENDAAVNRWMSVKGGVPVYHMGEPLSRFVMLSSFFDKVCLGSTSAWPDVGTAGWWSNMADFMDAICINGLPPCKLHGLRMLDPEVFTRLPLHSADSCNACVNADRCLKKGVYPSLERWQGSERIARRIEAHQSAVYWSRENLSSACSWSRDW